MRNTAGRIGTHLNEEKKLNESLEGGFEKTKEMVGNVMGSMDTMFGGATDSLCFYVCIFTTIMVFLLVKFGGD